MKIDRRVLLSGLSAALVSPRAVLAESVIDAAGLSHHHSEQG
jgi:hypothetical protein